VKKNVCAFGFCGVFFGIDEDDDYAVCLIFWIDCLLTNLQIKTDIVQLE